jgi:hypothetical protein
MHKGLIERNVAAIEEVERSLSADVPALAAYARDPDDAGPIDSNIINDIAVISFCFWGMEEKGILRLGGKWALRAVATIVEILDNTIRFLAVRRVGDEDKHKLIRASITAIEGYFTALRDAAKLPPTPGLFKA